MAETTGSESLAALERFVVENDDLLALGIARAEIRHSNFLAWLLDPGESHGQGDLFLKALLMDLARRARDQGFNPPFSPVHLDGADLANVEIRREWKSLDLLVLSSEPAFVIVVENKVDSGEHSNQLHRYEETLAREFPDRSAMLVFLTPDGAEASDDDWISYSYADIHRVLSRVKRTNTGSVGADVAAFLEHYLRLIESRMMDDPNIDELCRRIYKNHRAAIDLIVERAGVGGNRVLDSVAELIKADSRWHWVNTTTKWVVFMPQPLFETLLPIGDRPQFGKTEWIVFYLRRDRKGLVLGLTVWPTTDAAVRERVIRRLTRDRSEFGLRTGAKGTMGRWTNLARERVIHVDLDDEDVDEQAVETAVRQCLDSLWRRFGSLHEIVSTAIRDSAA
jgi:hypothetical protein